MARILSLFLKSPLSPLSQEERIAKLIPLAKALYRFSPLLAFDDYSRHESCGEPFRFPSRMRREALAQRLQNRCLQEESDPLSFGINLDLSGTEKLFPDPKELFRKISETASLHGFLSRMALSPTLGASWGGARWGKSRVVFVSREHLRSFAEELPISAFRLSEKELLAFEELGVRFGHELFRFPRGALLDRFGVGILKRIDQLLGVVQEPLPKCRIHFALSVRREFDVSLDSVHAIARAVFAALREFLQKVQESHQKVGALRFEFITEQRQAFQKVLRLSSPVSGREEKDVLYIQKLLEPFFENLAVDSPVREIGISSSHAESQQKLQLPHEGTSRESFAQLLDVLSEHLGPEEVQQVACFPEHQPEKSFAYVARGSAALTQSVAPRFCEERPSLLFYCPSPIKVIAPLPDGPPAWLEWREKHYRVAHAIGPERIAPAWWGDDSRQFLSKDYFRVQVPSGSWLWIFREHTRWFVHGVWM